MSGYAIDWSSGVVWIVFAGGFVAGCLLTYLFVRLGSRTARLQRELDRLKAEHADYRRQVHDHFGKTSVLFQRMTGSYRAVYEHLARGCESLCDDDTIPGRIELPQTRLLRDRGDEQSSSPARAADRQIDELVDQELTSRHLERQPSR